ncbi:uncharacterized protein C2845_PM18G03870 [Panicum miliaceum]|uniref:F-box domain-containing protein n=1 Tax=Panicum miliaceum TaxID=4540 RepID=A0A3L6PGW2_PANMI|nr:uncharacterized protein C2845_PM18G03870 [Panicum miliaceum]
MPPPLRKSLQDLDMDTQRLILSRIPCIVDRGRISLVCRAWRDMVRSQQHMLVGRLLPQPRSLPWLLLRAPFPAGSSRVVCVLSGCRVHHYLNITPPDGGGARCFGSHDGAWLLVDTREPVHRAAAVNARTGAFRDLPRELLRRTEPYVYRMVIHAAALSSSPDSANCVGAAIVTAWRHPAPCAGPPPRRRCVALWRRDWPRALDFMPPGQDDVSLNEEDVLYLNHCGAFAFVTQGEHLRLSYKVDKYPGFKEGIYFLDDGKFYDDAVIFDNGNGNHYPCSDNGKWSEGQIQRCFPRSDPSVHSAPVWLLP